MRPNASKLALMLLVLCAGEQAVADTVFDGGPFNIENGQPITDWRMAEDLQVDLAATINGATVPVIDLFGHSLDGWDGTLQWGIYEAVSGDPFSETKPGNLIVGAAHRWRAPSLIATPPPARPTP